MSQFLWSLTIYSFLGMCSLLEAGASKIPMDKLGLHKENYNEIVRDLIKNWESPIVYLRQLGYLPSDYEDTSKIKPNLDALMSRMERDDERESLGQDGDKSKQLFCGTADIRTKKKRENVLKLKLKAERRQRAASGSQGVNYPSVDQMLAMKQPSLAVAMSAAKVDELMPKQKPADHHSTCNSQVILLSSLLAKQQPEQVQQHTEMNRKTDDFLQRLVAKTSPQQTETQVAATAGNQATQLVGSLGEDAAKRTPEILPSNRIRSEDTNSLIARMRRNLRARLTHRGI